MGDLNQINSIQELKELLVSRRKDLGLTQNELASLCQLSLNGISKFESDDGGREVKLSTLLKLAPILGFRLKIEFES